MEFDFLHNDNELVVLYQKQIVILEQRILLMGEEIALLKKKLQTPLKENKNSKLESKVAAVGKLESKVPPVDKLESKISIIDKRENINSDVKKIIENKILKEERIDENNDGVNKNNHRDYSNSACERVKNQLTYRLGRVYFEKKNSFIWIFYLLKEIKEYKEVRVNNNKTKLVDNFLLPDYKKSLDLKKSSIYLAGEEIMKVRNNYFSIFTLHNRLHKIKRNENEK